MMKSWVIRLHQGSNYPTGIFLDGIWSVLSYWDGYFVILVCFIVQNTQKYVKIDHDVKEKNYTHLHSCDNIVNHTCSLGFKLPNRGGWSYWGDYFVIEVCFIDQNTQNYVKIDHDIKIKQGITSNYTTLSRRIDKIVTHVLCVHRVPNYLTNYPTWLFPMSVTR